MASSGSSKLSGSCDVQHGQLSSHWELHVWSQSFEGIAEVSLILQVDLLELLKESDLECVQVCVMECEQAQTLGHLKVRNQENLWEISQALQISAETSEVMRETRLVDGDSMCWNVSHLSAKAQNSNFISHGFPKFKYVLSHLFACLLDNAI